MGEQKTSKSEWHIGRNATPSVLIRDNTTLANKCTLTTDDKPSEVMPFTFVNPQHLQTPQKDL